jgi:prepilin-type N-terminal cleavage/methylation domain-containing protein
MIARRAFSLVEMLIATALATILLGGVLAMSAALARDQKHLSRQATTSADGIVELLRFDIGNARTITQSNDGRTVIFVGHGALDRRSGAATNRLALVTWSIDPDGMLLWRTQQYLDEPARPARWRELIAGDVARIEIAHASPDSEIVREPAVTAAMLRSRARIGDVSIVPEQPVSWTVSTRVRVHIASRSTPIDQEIFAR